MWYTKNSLGRLGETIAAFEYIKKGYRVLGRNLRVHSVKQIGEIDIVLSKGYQLVFVEVKTRTSGLFGTGLESVTWAKRRKLVRAAKAFLFAWPEYYGYDWRFDVVQVDIDKQGCHAIMLENVIEDLD